MTPVVREQDVGDSGAVPDARRNGFVLDPLALEHVAHVAESEAAALLRDIEEEDEPAAARRLAVSL